MSISKWLKQNRMEDKEVKVQLSEHFKDPLTGEPYEWTLTPLTTDRVEELQENCMENVRNPLNGQMTRQLNGMRYLNGLAAETVSDPPLHDEELQNSYDSAGSSVLTMNRMLSPDEKTRLLQIISRMYKLNPTDQDEVVKDIKNASGQANGNTPAVQ